MNLADAKETLATLKQCAVDSGIYPYWFLSFGTQLGCVRGAPRQGDPFDWYREPMSHDNDMDIGILADKITPEQEADYINRIKSAGLFAHREKKQVRTDNNRPVWFSLRGKDNNVGGTKVCHWLWQPHQNWYWHTKGKDWVKDLKFKQIFLNYKDTDEAVMLGIDKELISNFVEVEFAGGVYNIPCKFGSCLDWWYPVWHQLKGGSSAKRLHCIVDKWETPDSWRIVKWIK